MNIKRIEWIDILKGLGIILVVLSHTFRDPMVNNYFFIEYVYKYIYSFHMPLFFFLAGITFFIAHIRGKVGIKKSFTNLFIPWLSYTLILYIFVFGASCLLEFKEMNLIDYLLLCIQLQNPFSFHLWFLLELFFIQLICICLLKKTLNMNTSNIIIILFISMILMIFDPPYLLIKFTFEYLFYFLLGIIFIKYDFSERSYSMRLLIPSLIVIFIKTYFNLDIFFINIFNYFVLIPLTILGLIELSKTILNTRYCKIFRKLGSCSMAIYLFHQPMCAVIGTILLSLLGLSIVSSISIIIICFAACITIPFTFNYIFRNQFFYFLFLRLFNIDLDKIKK